jgi:sugar phosphate isomerase/epimerase
MNPSTSHLHRQEPNSTFGANPGIHPPGVSRRSFTFLLGTGLASIACTKNVEPRLNIGVGTFSYHTVSMDEMITQLTRLNIKEVEMSRGEFMLMNPPTPEMCQAARDKFERAGIRCVSYYTATIKDDWDLNLAVRFAHLLGARNISGDATGSILHRIDQRFTAEGLTFGIHNHWFKQKFAYETIDDVLKGLSGLSQTVGATLDVGQMAACGQDPVAAVRRLKRHLKVVHLKDVASAGAEHNVLFGRGVVDLPAVMRELKTAHFKGLVAIEYEKEKNSDQDMTYLVGYARRLA